MKKGKEEKNLIKVKFEIIVKQVNGLPKELNRRSLVVEWRRGTKKINRGETRSAQIADGLAIWLGSERETFTFQSKLVHYTKLNKFEQKDLRLALKNGFGKKADVLYKVEVNLGEMATNGYNLCRDVKFPSKLKSVPGPVLSLQVKAEWLKINNKKLVKKSGSEIKYVIRGNAMEALGLTTGGSAIVNSSNGVTHNNNNTNNNNPYIVLNNNNNNSNTNIGGGDRNPLSRAVSARERAALSPPVPAFGSASLRTRGVTVIPKSASSSVIPNSNFIQSNNNNNNSKNNLSLKSSSSSSASSSSFSSSSSSSLLPYKLDDYELVSESDTEYSESLASEGDISESEDDFFSDDDDDDDKGNKDGDGSDDDGKNLSDFEWDKPDDDEDKSKKTKTKRGNKAQQKEKKTQKTQLDNNSNNNFKDKENSAKLLVLKRENEKLKVKQRRLNDALLQAKKDSTAKDEDIYRLKCELEGKKEKKRRMDSVASILAHIEQSTAQGLPVDLASIETSFQETKVQMEEDNMVKEISILREGMKELRILLDKKDEDLKKLNGEVERLEAVLKQRDKELADTKKELEQEKVFKIDREIEKEREKLAELERMIKDKQEIQKLKEQLVAKDKEIESLRKGLT